jgi:hypothetical protein
LYLRPVVLSLALALVLVGCGGAPQRSPPPLRCPAPRAWSGAFAACARVDLGKIVTWTRQSVQQSVTDAVADDPATVDAALDAIAADAGDDAIECAIAAIESSVPRALGEAAETFYPGLAAARAWIARRLTSSGRWRS